MSEEDRVVEHGRNKSKSLYWFLVKHFDNIVMASVRARLIHYRSIEKRVKMIIWDKTGKNHGMRKGQVEESAKIYWQNNITPSVFVFHTIKEWRFTFQMSLKKKVTESNLCMLINIHQRCILETESPLTINLRGDRSFYENQLGTPPMR